MGSIIFAVLVAAVFITNIFVLIAEDK